MQSFLNAVGEGFIPSHFGAFLVRFFSLRVILHEAHVLAKPSRLGAVAAGLSNDPCQCRPFGGDLILELSHFRFGSLEAGHRFDGEALVADVSDLDREEGAPSLEPGDHLSLFAVGGPPAGSLGRARASQGSDLGPSREETYRRW